MWIRALVAFGGILAVALAAFAFAWYALGVVEASKKAKTPGHPPADR